MSELHTQRDARHLPACIARGPTMRCSLLHRVGAANGMCGRGGQASSGRFLPCLAHSKQQQHKRAKSISKRVVYTELNDAVLMCG